MTAVPAGLERAGELLARRIGLRLSGSMRGRVARALGDAAAAAGIPPEEYAHTLPDAPAELQRLIDRITVQETSFFRDAPHFAVLLRRALPGLPPGTVWSAGCANGQEAWSLAIALEEAGAGGWQVLATDVSRDAVARTRAGAYSDREVAGLSPERRARFLRRLDDGRWEIGAGLRGRVQVQAHNLVEQPPPARAPVVFCRNVLIYLDAGSTRRALDALRLGMPDDGWLFLGAAEALAARDAPFAPQRVDGTYAYRPRARSAPAPAGPRRAAGQAAAPRGVTPSAPMPGAAGLAAEGEAHAAAGRYREAAAAFRRAAYLTPADPLAHLQLGLALERGGEPAAAARAFRAARTALGRAGALPDLGGWAPGELTRLLDAKLGGD